MAVDAAVLITVATCVLHPDWAPLVGVGYLLVLAAWMSWVGMLPGDAGPYLD